MSLSTNVSNLATRIATEVKALRTLVNGNVADLSALSTTAKANLVLAINEIKSALDTAASDISALESADITLAGDISAVDAKVGTLSLLSTTDKTNLVSAINELQFELDNLDVSGQVGALISDTTTVTNKTWSSSKISSEIDTAEADAVTTANAYTDALINDGIPSTSKVWSSDKTYFEINNAVSALVDGAPALLDTLNELAAAIADDPSFATTITAAIAAKADDSAVVHLTGAETIAGVKTFSDAPVVPDASFTIAKTSGLQAALDSKASAANVGDTTVNYVTTFEAGLV